MKTASRKPRQSGKDSKHAATGSGRDTRAAVLAATPETRVSKPLGSSVLSMQALWVSLGLIAVNWIIYAPVRHYGFVNYDDTGYNGENPHIAAGLSWESLRWAFTTGEQFYWHPLTWLSHIVDFQLYGMNAGPPHVTNVLLHTANSILLFALLLRMTGALGRSAFVAGLFAVHPLHVESVAWMAERKDVLSTLFWALTVWAYVDYVRRPGWGRYLWVAVLFALGLLAKPMLVTLPLLLLLLDFWPLRRVSLGAGGWSASFRQQAPVWKRMVLEKLPLLALSAVASILTFVFQQKMGAALGFDAFPLKLRLENIPIGYLTYIRQTLWPAGLAVHYPYRWTPSVPLVMGGLIVLLAISALVSWQSGRRPYLLVGWLWYLGMLVPVIGIIQSGSQSTADHFTYVPLVGLCIMAAWGIPDLLPDWSTRNAVLAIAAAVVVLVCVVASRRQVGYWQSSEALWEHTLAVTEGNYFAHYNLGLVAESEGRHDDAIAHYVQALQIKPDYADAQGRWGIALTSEGKTAEAIQHYSEALRLQPGSAEVHYNLGIALAQQGRLDEAIKHYSEAVRLKPDFADAHNNLGAALSSEGKVDAALQEFLASLEIKPDADAHFNAGTMLVQLGRTQEAAQHFQAALQLNPGHEAARRGLQSLGLTP